MVLRKVNGQKDQQETGDCVEEASEMIGKDGRRRIESTVTGS